MRVITTKSENCSGCKACQVLCSLTNFAENNPKMAALQIIGHFPDPGTYEINICSQCGVCADACPVKAISAGSDAWVIDSEMCIGCGACVAACPTHSFVQHASKTAPIKCTSCGACVEYCPRKALIWQEG